jgi:hypothetical protein
MNTDIYDTMIDNDEMWYVLANGNAFIMYDLPIFDA